MPARVTQGMLNIQFMRNLNKNLTRMDNLQNQMSSGMKINKPSDDPVGITYGLRYRSELSANEQYTRNVDMANSWLSFTDSVLNQAGEVFQRLRELTVNASNGTNPDTAMEAIKSEVKELRGQLLDIGNSKMNGKYIFNGQYIDKAPYTDGSAASDPTDPYSIEFEVGASVKMPVNISGNAVFGNPDESDNAFKVFDDLIGELEANNFNGVSAMLNRIDQRVDKFLSVRADIGARVNRVELVENRLGDLGINLETLQSKVEDADMADILTKLKMDENVYQASLSVGSRLIRPSLIDFLR